MSGDAVEGDLVALEMLREGGFGLPSARVVERLGSVDSERAISLIALAAHDIPHVFSPAALAEAEAARPATHGRPRGLARSRRSSPSTRPTPRTTTTRSTPRPTPTPPIRAASSSPSPSPTSPITSAPARRSTRRRWSAAIRSISPTASCRCCPSASPTISARCAPHEDRPALAVRMILGADGRKTPPHVSIAS